MRFLDANVFIYAYYRPRRQLTKREKEMKEEAKRIISEASQGKEEVETTVVHLSEVVNILKHGMPIDKLNQFITGLFMLDNIEVRGVSREAYFAAAELGGDLNLDPNDALAVESMRSDDINEIYSFDEDFDRIEGISRLPRPRDA